MTRHAAVDLGASSGRVVIADVDRGLLALTEVHRFANGPVTKPDGLHWDIRSLYDSALEGLAKAGRDLDSIGIDSWAIDYGLLDSRGELLGDPFHYRDSRTDRSESPLPRERLYAINGLQHLPFATLYQLAATQGTAAWEAARTLLLVPDLLSYWLTGARHAELTNASTTGLLDVTTRRWAPEVAEALTLRDGLLPELVRPGADLGPLLPTVRARTGLSARTVLTVVGSHDTASAVVGIPMAGDHAAYISLGTWGLVGVELDQPVLTDDSRTANFTNELGVDDRVRYLRNVMGLWLLQECLREWGEPDLPILLARAAEIPVGGPVFDVDDPRLLAPGDMPARIAGVLDESGWRPLRRRVELVRCIIDSLAVALARTVADAARLSGRVLKQVHLVGGGARNALLCQLTADACGLPVLAGPVEATAIGNLLVQARAAGTLSGDLDALRSLVRRTVDVQRYEPRP